MVCSEALSTAEPCATNSDYSEKSDSLDNKASWISMPTFPAWPHFSLSLVALGRGDVHYALSSKKKLFLCLSLLLSANDLAPCLEIWRENTYAFYLTN